MWWATKFRRLLSNTTLHVAHRAHLQGYVTNHSLSSQTFQPQCMSTTSLTTFTKTIAVTSNPAIISSLWVKTELSQRSRRHKLATPFTTTQMSTLPILDLWVVSTFQLRNMPATSLYRVVWSLSPFSLMLITFLLQNSQPLMWQPVTLLLTVRTSLGNQIEITSSKINR